MKGGCDELINFMENKLVFKCCLPISMRVATVAPKNLIITGGPAICRPFLNFSTFFLDFGDSYLNQLTSQRTIKKFN